MSMCLSAYQGAAALRRRRRPARGQPVDSRRPFICSSASKKFIGGEPMKLATNDADFHHHDPLLNAPLDLARRKAMRDELLDRNLLIDHEPADFGPLAERKIP